MSWDGESWRKAAREYAAGRAASRTVLEVEIEPDRLRSLRWLARGYRVARPRVARDEVSDRAQGARGI
jgi:hypothetical protein